VSEWLKLFANKLEKVAVWKQQAESGRLLQEELDLSEVYRPEIFLNALKQRVGRQQKVPVNQLKIKSSFSKPSSASVKIKNLILQGCSFMDGGIG
jgi:dynein heavy chain 2, cytosolic